MDTEASILLKPASFVKSHKTPFLDLVLSGNKGRGVGRKHNQDFFQSDVIKETEFRIFLEYCAQWPEVLGAQNLRKVSKVASDP